MNNEKLTINRHCDWLDNPIHTGIVNPDTGKEFILSGYYEDETGNSHFTHQQALEIADRTPGWELCTDKFHQILADTVWNSDTGKWKDNVLNTGLNGFEYLTRKLKYELAGYKFIAASDCFVRGEHGACWSSSVIYGFM